MVRGGAVAGRENGENADHTCNGMPAKSPGNAAGATG
jgi:hypothetical protein